MLWLWWCQPERQIPRAQRRLLSAVESRDFGAMAVLLADDYRDRWGHDKAIVLRDVQEVFGQFVLLTIEQRESTLALLADGWAVQEKIIIKGLGGALAIYARDRVNALREPFYMTWRRRGWKPWDWELTSVEQRELQLER